MIGLIDKIGILPQQVSPQRLDYGRIIDKGLARVLISGAALGHAVAAEGAAVGSTGKSGSGLEAALQAGPVPA